MTLQHAKAIIKVLEADVQTWKILYARAIKHDERVIQQVRKEVAHAEN
jgi:hypothetical protein